MMGFAGGSRSWAAASIRTSASRRSRDRSAGGNVFTVGALNEVEHLAPGLGRRVAVLLEGPVEEGMGGALEDDHPMREVGGIQLAVKGEEFFLGRVVRAGDQQQEGRLHRRDQVPDAGRHAV